MPSASAGGAPPSKAPATPFGKLQLTTPIKSTRAATAAAAAARSSNTADDRSPGAGVISPLTRLGIKTPDDKLEAPQPDGLQVYTLRGCKCCGIGQQVESK